MTTADIRPLKKGVSRNTSTTGKVCMDPSMKAQR